MLELTCCAVFRGCNVECLCLTAYANALRKQMGLCASRETGLDKTDDDGTWMIIEDSKLLIPRHQLDLGEIIGQGG